MYVGVPTDLFPGSPAADRPTRRPPRFGSTKGEEGVPSPPPPLGAGCPPPPHSPQSHCTLVGVTHWVAAAPVHRALACNVLLLMRRLHMYVVRMFVTCEDLRLKSAPDIIFHVLKDFTLDSWEAMLHLSTSTVPQVGKVDPQLGIYDICDALWTEPASVDFGTTILDVSLPRDLYFPTLEDMVLPMVRWLPLLGRLPLWIGSAL